LEIGFSPNIFNGGNVTPAWSYSQCFIRGGPHQGPALYPFLYLLLNTYILYLLKKIAALFLTLAKNLPQHDIN